MTHQPATGRIVAREVYKSFGTHVAKIGHQVKARTSLRDITIRRAETAGAVPQTMEVTA